MFIEISIAGIDRTDNIVTEFEPVSTFRDTQILKQFVSLDDKRMLRMISCLDCFRKCQHFRLGYYKSCKPLNINIPSVATRCKKNKY